MRTPLGGCHSDRLIGEIGKFVDELRRQAPAARMIGQFAVNQAVRTIGDRLRPTGANPDRQS